MDFFYHSSYSPSYYTSYYDRYTGTAQNYWHGTICCVQKSYALSLHSDMLLHALFFLYHYYQLTVQSQVAMYVSVP